MAASEDHTCKRGRRCQMWMAVSSASCTLAARMVSQLHAGVPVEALLMQHPLLLRLILVMLFLLMSLFR